MFAQVIAELLDAAGPGRILAVGSGSSRILRELLEAGFDACAVDPLAENGNAGGAQSTARVRSGSILSVPFPDADFDTVIWTDAAAHSDPAAVATALGELARITRRNAYLRIDGCLDREPWERRLFDAGFRKHPNSFRINSYELLERPSPPITLFMEKMRVGAGAAPFLHSGRIVDVPPDMLRESGRESDAHLVRYHLAGRYVRPNDVVADLQCGCGDGLHVLRHNSPGHAFIGIDRRPAAIDYAGRHYADDGPIPDFRAGEASEILASMPASSVHVVIAFDLLTGQADADGPLVQAKRVLIPGGRIILSIPSRSGPRCEDVRGFTLDEINGLLGSHFLAEDIYEQHAASEPAPTASSPDAGRWIRQISWQQAAAPAGQWWIATGIRDPLTGADVPYQETIFANISSVGHLSTDYARWYHNSWILHSLVHAGYRVKSPALLTRLAQRLLEMSPPDSADHGAALCILAYRMAGRACSESESWALIERILRYLDVRSDNPHVLRWRISLTFVLGQLCQRSGAIEQARHFYRTCAELDATLFSIHLTTKTADSCFWWGWLALNQGDLADAEKAWKAGVALGNRLLGRPIDDILMNPEFPNLFDHGDGMREFVYALESVTMCANGIHLLMRQKNGNAVDWNDVQKTFRNRGQRLALELVEAQEKLATLSSQLDETRKALIGRTTEAVDARSDLTSRTEALDATRADLLARTEELIEARRDLVSRTADLDTARKDLISRSEELIEARRDLVSRTADLDAVRKELVGRSEELIEARRDLVSRTLELDAARRDLTAARSDLALRTSERDADRAHLASVTGELAAIRRRPIVNALRIVSRHWISGKS